MKQRLFVAPVILFAALFGSAACQHSPKPSRPELDSRPPLATTMPTSLSTPPVAERHAFTSTTPGDARTDDYHWLREKDSPAVLDYINKENAYTDAILAPTASLQKTLVNEFEAHTKLDDQSVPYPRADGWLYYDETDEKSDYPRFYRKHPLGSLPPQLLLDLNELAKTQDYVGLGDLEPSDDGKLLAYTIDPTGFRQYKLSIKDLDTGRLLPDTADRVTSFTWANDGQTFFFGTENDAKRSDKIWRQTLGGQPELVYEEKDETFDVSVGKTLDRKWIIIGAVSYGTADARVIPADQPSTAPRLLAPRTKDVELYAASHRDGKFFIKINDTGRNFRLLELADDAADISQAVEVIPDRPDVFLEDVNCFRSHIVLTERFAGLPRLALFDDVTKKEDPLPMPEPVYVVDFGTNEVFDTDKIRFGYQSLITPGTVFEYDVNTKKLATLKREEIPGGYDPSQYEQKMVYAPARDGQKIPISLVWKKGRGPGTHPLLLDVYGAYGLPEWVWFDSSRISLLDRGVAYAIAHVRGGGELGKPWHDAGRLMNKKNTFYDVVDAVTYLQKEKITSPEQTAIYGASAGGLTVGATLNERPELFKAALMGVPFVDVMNTMLDPTLPLTTQEYLEWGNPNEKAAHDYMLSYSPYDNLAAKKYPATLVFSSYHDSQVMYWEPTKYVAKRRALSPADAPPLLLSLTMTGGHGGPSGRTSEFEVQAKHYAFILWQFGINK